MLAISGYKLLGAQKIKKDAEKVQDLHHHGCQRKRC
tara:strand:- start:2756 stop:2863 length:108 start_codon:yes stop_codon:yes gene_type:complete